VKKYGGLFISDEVQTGFGPYGKKWFGIEHWEVTPDIMTCAKGMANGAPIGATITTKELAASYQGLTISTFGGNPVTSVAAKPRSNSSKKKDFSRMRTRWAPTSGASWKSFNRIPVIGDVRGKGLMLALELVKDRETKEPARRQLRNCSSARATTGCSSARAGFTATSSDSPPWLNIAKSDVDEAASAAGQVTCGSTSLTL